MKKINVFFILCLTFCLICPSTYSFVNVHAESTPIIESTNLGLVLQNGQDVSIDDTTLYVTDVTTNGGEVIKYNLDSKTSDIMQLRDANNDITQPNAIAINYSDSLAISAKNAPQRY